MLYFSTEMVHQKYPLLCKQDNSILMNVSMHVQIVVGGNSDYAETLAQSNKSSSCPVVSWFYSIDTSCHYAFFYLLVCDFSKDFIPNVC